MVRGKNAMEIKELFREIKKFSSENQGSSNYFKEDYFIQGENEKEYAPFTYLKKTISWPESINDLLKKGFALNSYAFFGSIPFLNWYETKFARKLSDSGNPKITIVKLMDNKSIISAIEKANDAYSVFREQKIILNGKNLPTQLGEWYARIIFGLFQKKSASQRGFDFKIGDKTVEVKVHWADSSSPKGVKLKRSLIALSEFCIIIYLANNFMIREICFLDSPFIIRKFGAKSQTIFLKDSDISDYFYGKSKKHKDKIVNPVALLKFSTPTFALKMADIIQ
jgi:hypothetical protein